MSTERDRDRLRTWLERFGRAWERRDLEQLAALFSEDGSYRETPFDEPLVGADAIRIYWSCLPNARQDISFGYEVLTVTQPWGIARWRGSYTADERDTRVELDGMLLISLDDGPLSGLP